MTTQLPSPTSTRTRAALGAVLAADLALFAVLVQDTGYRHHAVVLYCVSVPVFVLATWLLARSALSRRAAVILIFGVGVVLQLIAVSKPTTTSDDDYRYLWDAKVQFAGIDPYSYPPDAPALARLRDGFLFPASPCPHPFPGGCTAINRPDVHTIYPPVAEGAFALIRAASFGGHGQHLPVQLAGALGVIAIGWLLWRRARVRGWPPWTVALWLWCPLPILEYSNAGHIDWLAVLLTVLALSVAAIRRNALAGLLLGAAIATKIYPAVVLPAMLKRRPWVVLASAAGLVAVSYLPHVLAVGAGVLGYLPGYLQEEQYTSGGGLLLLGFVLPHPVDTLVGAVLIALVAWFVYRHADPDAPEDGAVVIMGAALLIATPAYGWYAGLLLALVVLSGALEWLPVALAPTLAFLLRADFGNSAYLSRLAYFVAALLALCMFVLRRKGWDVLRRYGHDGVAVGAQ